MSHQAFDEEPEPQNTYWLRRVLVVLAGLLALSLLWWVGSSLFGGGDKDTQVVTATPQNSEAPASATPSPMATPSGTPTASSSATPGASASPAVVATPGASTSVTPAASATPAATPAASASTSATPAAVTTASVVCDPSALALDVSGDARPKIGTPSKIQVAITNTGKAECYLDFAKTPMAMKITSGVDRVWATATCQAWAPSGVVPLAAGKSWTWSMTWAEKRATGCTLSKNNLAAGTYVATASMGDATTDRMVMVLHH